MMIEVEETFNAQTPLKRVVICCTSLTQDVRTKLADIAIQMGAIHKLDLTSDVTHLLVGNTSTPKYKYVAKDRPDIKVLKPEWIEAVRQSWLQGGDANVSALEVEYRLPTFSGLHICVTGFEDLEQRTAISSTVAKEGAEYHGDLTKQVTHLIAAAPQGAKYTHAKQWGISIVSVQWFQDSLVRGMALDESLYDPCVPIEEQGRNAWRKDMKPRTSLGKRERAAETQAGAADEAGKRKMRRTASVRLKSHSQSLWQDISAGEERPMSANVDQWEDQGDRRSRQPSEAPFHAMAASVSSRACTGEEQSSRPTTATAEPDGLFSGYYVLIHGFEARKHDLLLGFLEPNGASIAKGATDLDTASRDTFFRGRVLLVPQQPSDAARKLPDVPVGTTVTTEWWVERCVHHKRCLEPSEDILSMPLHELTIPGFSELTICSTGFAGIDLLHLSKAINLVGATYQEKFMPSTSLLISSAGSIKKEKAYYAKKHGIPVVSADWLWACLNSRRQAPVKAHLVALPDFDPKEAIGEPSTSSPAIDEPPSGRPSDIGRRKDDGLVKRLSNTRYRHATPTLQLQASRPTAGTVGPKTESMSMREEITTTELLHDDQSQLAASASPKPSQPLQEIPANASPRKKNQRTQPDGASLIPKPEETEKSQTQDTEFIAPPLSPPKSSRSPKRSPSEQMQPERVAQSTTSRPPEALAADLASILSRHTSRPNTSKHEPPQRRKSKPLGRAASNMSSRSSIASADATLPSEVPESVIGGFHISREAQLPPSTQLGYEQPEADELRAKMSKKIGTVFADENAGKRVASLGVVKDSELSKTGVAGRVRGRHRQGRGV